MRYITLDGYIYSEGIRDIYSFEFFSPYELNVSTSLQDAVADWCKRYKKNRYKITNQQEEDEFQALDEEAINLSRCILKETNEYKIDYYYSDHFGTTTYILRE